MSSTEHYEADTYPRRKTSRFCPHCGGLVRLADCPIVATSASSIEAPEDNARVPARAASVSTPEDLAFRVRGQADDPPAPSSPAGDDSEELERRVMRAETVRAGGRLISQVDGLARLILAEGVGYRRDLRNPRLESAAATVRDRVGPESRPARACPRCRHPLPGTIDFRETVPVILVGHSEASKTTTAVAIVEESGRRGPSEFGVLEFSATETAVAFLMERDQRIFHKFRTGQSFGLTQPGRYPPLEFDVTLSHGEELTLFLYDLAGEELRSREIRLHRAPGLLWADAIIFIYNPHHSTMLDTSGQPPQAALLNGLRRDLEEARYPGLSSTPTLVVAVSKADFIASELGISINVRDGGYSDADVKSVLSQLGDTAVIHAAERFGTDVHWRFIAPMPDAGGGPQGVVDLFKLVLARVHSDQ